MPAFQVTRTAGIDSERETVFSLVRDFRKWPQWSPWLIAEPDCALTFRDDGDGYSWDGKFIGAGSIRVTSETGKDQLDLELSFLRPYKSVSTVRFDFSDRNGGTEVAWSMNSSLPVFLFWMKDLMVGMLSMDYDRGLRMLKDLAELGSVPSMLECGPETFAGCSYLGIRSSSHFDEIGVAMKRDFALLQDVLGQPSGPPISIYHRWNMGRRLAQFTVAYPFESPPEVADSRLQAGTITPMKTYVIRHTGPYRHIGNAWSTGMMRGGKAFKKRMLAKPFEVYENDPDEVGENELVTAVHLPMR